MSKPSDAEGEAAETIPWLDFAVSRNYLDEEKHADLRETYGGIRGGLIRMMKKPTPWCGPSALREPDIDYGVDQDRNGLPDEL